MDEQDYIDKTEEQAKKIGKDAARAAKKAAGKAIKAALKKLFMLFGIKGIIIFATVIIIIIFLASSWYTINTNTFHSSSEILDSVSSGSSNVSATGGANYTTANARGLVTINEADRSLNLNTTEFEEKMTEWFKANSIDPKTLGISDDYKEFKTFLEAEVTTLYPDFRTVDEIGTAVPEGTLQGCIQFHRQFEDGTSQVLEFMPYDEYATELAKLGLKLDDTITQEKIYTSRTDVEKQYNYIKNYFTLDSKQNLVIAKLTASETIVAYSDWAEKENKQYGDGTEYSYTFSVNKELINYQAAVEDYSMPFEFCVALLLTSQNPGYCMEVANLAKNSSIIVDILDNATTTITTRVYSYESEFSLTEDVTYYTQETITEEYDYVPGAPAALQETIMQSQGQNGKITRTRTEKHGPFYESNYAMQNVTVDNYETVVTTSYNVSVKAQLVKAETWIASINVTYSNTPSNDSNTSTSTEEDDDATTGFKYVPNYHMDELNYPHASEGSDWVDVSRTYLTSERRYNKKTTYTSNTSKNSYSETSKDVKETPDKFLSLLKVDSSTGKFDLYNLANNKELKKYANAKGKLESPENNLLSAEAMLIEMLSSNTKTANAKLDETTEYLLDLYQGKVAYDQNRFSMYEPGEFKRVNSGRYGSGYLYGNSTQEKIWWAVIDAGFSKEAAAGVIGYCWGESRFDPGAVNQSSGASGIAQWLGGRKAGLIAYADSKGVEWTDVDTQIEYMIAEMTGSGQCGATYQYMSAYRTEYNEWLNADNPEDAEHGFLRWFGRPATTVEAVKNFPRQTGRENAAREYYDEYYDNERPTGGEWTYVGSNHIAGYFDSYITGRRYYVYQQSRSFWGGLCNRAAAASICSGYYEDAPEILPTIVDTNYSGRALAVDNNSFYGIFGLKLNYSENIDNSAKHGGTIDTDFIRQQLMSGNYIALWVSNGGGDGVNIPTYGKSGVNWTSAYHWLAIIGYRDENGVEQMFVSDSGSGHSGWYDLDEFNTNNTVCRIMGVTEI